MNTSPIALLWAVVSLLAWYEGRSRRTATLVQAHTFARLLAARWGCALPKEPAALAPTAERLHHIDAELLAEARSRSAHDSRVANGLVWCLQRLEERWCPTQPPALRPVRRQSHSARSASDALLAEIAEIDRAERKLDEWAQAGADCLYLDGRRPVPAQACDLPADLPHWPLRSREAVELVRRAA